MHKAPVCPDNTRAESQAKALVHTTHSTSNSIVQLALATAVPSSCLLSTHTPTAAAIVMSSATKLIQPSSSRWLQSICLHPLHALALPGNPQSTHAHLFATTQKSNTLHVAGLMKMVGANASTISNSQLTDLSSTARCHCCCCCSAAFLAFMSAACALIACSAAVTLASAPAISAP